MLSSEIDLCFKNSILSNHYVGWFSSDNYPKGPFIGIKFFVVNKDPSSSKGSHWMVVFHNETIIEFFDPLGATIDFVRQFLKFSKPIVCYYNETQIQPLSSKSCGEFCVFFAFHRILNRDLSFSGILNRKFSLNLDKNELLVQKFISQL